MAEWRRRRLQKSLDEVRDRGAGLIMCGEGGTVEEFAFESGEERLGDRTVVTVTGRSDGAFHLVPFADLRELPRRSGAAGSPSGDGSTPPVRRWSSRLFGRRPRGRLPAPSYGSTAPTGRIPSPVPRAVNQPGQDPPSAGGTPPCTAVLISAPVLLPGVIIPKCPGANRSGQLQSPPDGRTGTGSPGRASWSPRRAVRPRPPAAP